MVTLYSWIHSIPILTLISFISVEEQKSGDGFDYLESPVSDGTIEENFEEELVNAPISGPYSIINSANDCEEDEDFSDVSQYGIVEVVGDDTYGRKIITVTACKLPNNNQLDHQRLLRYDCPSVSQTFVALGRSFT